MDRIALLGITGLFIATLGASAAQGSETQPATSEPPPKGQPQAAGEPRITVQSQVTSQRWKDENCVEVTGSRIKRCAGDSPGSAMVTSGKPPPDMSGFDTGTQNNFIRGTIGK